MFRLIRLVIFTGAAFVAGVLYERANAQNACIASGGKWIDTFCAGKEPPND